MKIFTCRICGRERKKLFLDKLTSKRGGEYSLMQCMHCEFVSLLPIPDKETLSQYYNSCYWHSSNSGHDVRLKPLINNLKNKYSEKILLLDWGCGDGAFVHLARKAGIYATGIDEYSVREFPYIIRGNIDSKDLEGKKYDVITAFHLLEHLPNPVRSLKQAVRLLDDKGIVIIEIPNIRSLSFKCFKRRWQPLQIPEHLNHFSPDSIKTTIKKADLKITKISMFSLRASLAVIPLSLFPFMAPEKIRQKHNGHFPLFLKMVYCMMQFVFLPASLLESMTGWGSIMRIYCVKNSVE